VTGGGGAVVVVVLIVVVVMVVVVVRIAGDEVLKAAHSKLSPIAARARTLRRVSLGGGDRGLFVAIDRSSFPEITLGWLGRSWAIG